MSGRQPPGPCEWHKVFCPCSGPLPNYTWQVCPLCLPRVCPLLISEVGKLRQERGQRWLQGHQGTPPTSASWRLTVPSDAHASRRWGPSRLFSPEAQRGQGSFPRSHSKCMAQAAERLQALLLGPLSAWWGAEGKPAEEGQARFAGASPLPRLSSPSPGFVWRMTHRNAAES